ncbi:MAG: alpha/beta hydrolase [Burkholderiaceae bacterium]|nr:alpha/beta hydrolase [Burkholderiaceae bacterium]
MNRRKFLEAGTVLAATGLLAGRASAAAPAAAQFEHKFAQVNGIRMHYVEAGQGPLVILLHGFPLLWYSWRKQIPALAAAGYRVVVPDQRGYGQTEAPADMRAYNITELVGDIVGLVAALGETQAIVAGWDWGSGIAQFCSLMRPDIFRATVLVSNPYSPRLPVRPSLVWQKLGNGKVFYQQYFQTPGVAEREMARDPKSFMRSALYMLSDDALPGDEWKFAFPPNTLMLDSMKQPKELPPWLSSADLDYYAAEYARSGFLGPLNWYRNMEFDWEITSYLTGAKLLQPSLFIAGEMDPGIQWGKAAFEQIERNMPNLRKKVLIPHAAHMAPEEQPEKFNAALLEFLNSLPRN